MSEPVTITLPEGEERRLWPESNEAGQKLAAWLEHRRAPLNTRCGQMGLCRGCEVELETASQSQTVRACQMRVADLPKDLVRVRIPANSWRDATLTGVSAFELDTQRAQPRLRPGLGLALDIGTTTVAAALWDLSTGQCLGLDSTANGQGRYGDNVLTRINHACARDEGPRDLQRVLIEETLAPLIARLCLAAGQPESAITEVMAAGNTVMLHTLAGEGLSGFAKYPFQPRFLSGQCWLARDLGFSFDAPLHSPDCLGPFVGADITAGALAAGMLESKEPTLLIDFGTNGEILLKHDGGLLAAATAAGPAFEGGRLRCGAAAGPGVASHIHWRDGGWEMVGVDNGRRSPRAISGAAYIDLLAELSSRGLLLPMGRLAAEHAEVAQREVDGELERFVALTKRLFITEADVAEILQAKAAIMAGVLTLLEEAELTLEDIGRVYVAGGFGYHLNLAHAMQIGLLPSLPPERFSVIGNASLGGASLLLLAADYEHLDRREQCRAIELNQCGSIEDYFIDCLTVAPCETDAVEK